MKRRTIKVDLKSRNDDSGSPVVWGLLAAGVLIVGTTLFGMQGTPVENEAAPHLVTISESQAAPPLGGAMAGPPAPTPSLGAPAATHEQAPGLPPGKFPDASQSRPGDM